MQGSDDLLHLFGELDYEPQSETLGARLARRVRNLVSWPAVSAAALVLALFSFLVHAPVSVSPSAASQPTDRIEARTAQLTSRLTDLAQRQAQQDAALAELRASNAELTSRNAELSARNAELRAAFEALQAQVQASADAARHPRPPRPPVLVIGPHGIRSAP